jgi:glutathione S-transferase
VTERHERIARRANEILAEKKVLLGRTFTAADVAIVFRAWQEDYRERKAAGKVRSSGRRNAWRKEE